MSELPRAPELGQVEDLGLKEVSVYLIKFCRNKAD